MNEHLKPVFEILLPKLEEAKIDYWVFGGISIAAFAREFIRRNKDVDIFIRDIDFKKARLILHDLCKQMNFLKYHFLVPKNNERPKIEIRINNIKRFSMIPIYLKDNMVVFRYEDGDQEYSNQILEKRERKISGYRFFTSLNEFIKDMFIKHIKARPDKKNRDKIKIDAKAILTPKEYRKLIII